MRTLSLTKSGYNKIKAHQSELKASDLEDSIKSLPPGEWCFLNGQNEHWAAFVNSQIDEKYPSTQVIASVRPEDTNTFNPEKIISQMIEQACSRRFIWNGYEKGSRLFYGQKDGLPGLIVDEFENAIIVQINTAGIDRYREFIKGTFHGLRKKSVYFLDNPKYRAREFLPTYETEVLPALQIVENDLHYKLRPEVLQKVGFYYDHRENRLQLMNMMKRLKEKPQFGLDLFCYAGAWGMNALKSGVQKMEFVDQGDFEEEVKVALDLNGFSERGMFHRADVFKFLEDAFSKKRIFDLVVCDPPAFAKSATQKPQALEGYSKLHRKVMKVAGAGSLCAFSSCTHYVSDQEFQKNIQESARKENRRLQLVYSGIQGFDHPVQSTDDRSNYIKSYFYILE